MHGCVGAGGPLGYGEGVGDDGDGGALNGAERRKRRRDRASVHEDATAGEIDAPQTTTRVLGGWYPDDRYRRGEDDGALGEKRDPRRAMSEGEVRRKRVKAGGGFRKWVLRRKRGGGDGDAVVR